MAQWLIATVTYLFLLVISRVIVKYE